MHQTFTGTSRRPRQVNLSGRSGNPFAAAGFGSPKSAIESAKEDRIRRQQERDRIAASSKIQRRWRGYSSRRKTFSIWRSIWDNTERDVSADGSYPSPEASLQQLYRLLLFYSPAQAREDSKRLRWYGMRQASTADRFTCEGKTWTTAYGQLRQACLATLSTKQETDENGETLRILAFAARRAGFRDMIQASHYYRTLMSLEGAPSDALQHALLAPLGFKESYAGLAVLLANPLDGQLLGLLKDHLNTEQLVRSLNETASTITSDRHRLWLLGNVLALCGGSSTAVTSLVLQLLANLVGNVSFEQVVHDPDNITFDRDHLSQGVLPFPVNDFLYNQMQTLISESSIRGLLTGQSDPVQAQLSANLVLTLLRCFPRKADEIRVWLFMGPKTGTDISACLQLWQIVRQMAIFRTITEDSQLVIPLIRQSNDSLDVKNDWATILLFLELYNFALKVMDDEDFLGRGKTARSSTVPVQDLAELVTFLKNLGFSLCFQANDLRDFSRPVPTHSIDTLAGDDAQLRPVTIAGISGVNADDLKGLAVGLMRAIYDRDSRRHFLPKGHWLMTKRFDMSAFVASVVEEEERRNSALDDLDDDDWVDEGDEAPTNIRGNSAAARHNRLRSHQKDMERRRLRGLAPLLEILQNMPFFIPFNIRVQIFRQFVLRDQMRRRHGHIDPEIWRLNMMSQGPIRSTLGRHHATIKRKHEVDDAFNQFYELGPALKEPIQITFTDEFGLQEAGIDGGGVTKEFLTSFVAQAFSREERFFVENEAHFLHPNPNAVEEAKMLHEMEDDGSDVNAAVRALLRRFEFLGRIIGKCLYEGILVDVSFASFFLKKWALTGGLGSSSGENGYRASLNDLRDFDQDLYRGLLNLKNAEDASDFGLSFAVDDMVRIAGQVRLLERSLGFQGADTPVTNENRLVYISALTRYRLQSQSAPQTNAFLKGLSLIIQPSWLSMFNQGELQTLVGGASTGIDVGDLRRNTSYGGTYVIGDDGQEHPSVQLFWKIMEGFSGEERGKVLKFVTSTPRGPLLGFSHLNPPFSIRDSGSDENRFPTTSTCVNLLKLPMYKSEETMRRKLVDAVNSGAGFDLS